MTTTKKTYPIETITQEEHLELNEIRQGARYSYRDAKLFCDIRDSYKHLADKLDLHEKI